MKWTDQVRLRRLLAVAVVFCLLATPAFAQTKKKKRRPAKPTPTTMPAEPAAPAEPPPPAQTAHELLQQLTRLRPQDAKRSDVALRAGLEFALACFAPDGGRAESLIDAVGYQPLPVEGDLPEVPEKPLLPTKVKELVSARGAIATDDLPPTIVRVQNRHEFFERHPAAAQWMLPDDFAVLFMPAEGKSNWVARECFVIVRVRAGRPTITGGSLLANLPSGATRTDNPRR